MSLVEETITNYTDFQDRIKAIDASKSKDHVVILFRLPDDKKLKNLKPILDIARKKGVKGTLIHVVIKKKEFADANCPYKKDAKFKVKELPCAVAYHQDITFNSEMIYEIVTAGGNISYTQLKFLNMFM